MTLKNYHLHIVVHLKTLLICLFATILFSCAGISHVPKSEIAMFQNKKLVDGSSVKTNYAHVYASGLLDFSDKSEILEKYPDWKKVGIGPTVGTHSIFMIGNKSAVSVFIGNNLGVDFTLGLPKQIYFTQSFNFMTKQSILQRRILDGNPIGLSVGINYQNSILPVYDQVDRTADCSRNRYLYCGTYHRRNTLGLRSVFTHSIQPRPQYKNKQMLYLSLNYSYDFSMRTFFPALSLSVATY